MVTNGVIKMTCADCKDYKICRYKFKSSVCSADGDFVANYCDEFKSIHKPHEVVKDGIRVYQSNRGGICDTE